MRERVMYVELKTGHDHDGPAWIGRVRFSKSGRTIYYRGLTLQRKRWGGGPGNYVDVATGDEYWVTGVKRNRQDRHWAGGGHVEVDPDAQDEYRQILSVPSDAPSVETSP